MLLFDSQERDPMYMHCMCCSVQNEKKENI